jgi:hypothetical protein
LDCQTDTDEGTPALLHHGNWLPFYTQKYRHSGIEDFKGPVYKTLIGRAKAWTF